MFIHLQNIIIVKLRPIEVILWRKEKRISKKIDIWQNIIVINTSAIHISYTIMNRNDTGSQENFNGPIHQKLFSDTGDAAINNFRMFITFH